MFAAFACHTSEDEHPPLAEAELWRVYTQIAPALTLICNPQDTTGGCPAGYVMAILFVLVTMTLWVVGWGRVC